MRRFVLLFVFLVAMLAIKANNVRIIQDVTVGDVVNNMAELKFTIAWDNSWRDDFNWDAVYVFMKYKKTTETAWKHALFAEEGHTLSTGFEYWMARYTTTANNRQGIFILQSDKKKGAAEVEATLRWNVAGPGYTQNDFMEGKVEMSLMCIEMVYIPKGPFFLGDGVSKNTFRSVYRSILPEWDLIKNDGTQKYTASNSDPGVDYSVAGPANRVNEGRNSLGTAGGNVWYAKAGSSIWQVELAEPKEVRYFGVSGVRGYSKPQTWIFEGSVNGQDNWRPLTDNLGDADWPLEYDSYPVPKAIAVKPEMVGKYKFYRIRIITASSAVPLSNIAMTDVDLSKVNDNGFVVDGQDIPMNEIRGLSTDDGDKWTGSLPSTNTTSNVYPTGFEGFYVMKYEISQEQYVRFLNKLTTTQQVKRTRDDLEQLNIGDYVYGRNTDAPSNRNGIVIGARVNGIVIFACDLNSGNKVSQDDDGQTLACNYLSVNDMLAYADWAGLRPLSEMEYEKMARRPYPMCPGQKDWAGGKTGEVILPSGATFTGTVGQYDECLTGANVNAGGKVTGPIRVGSFAKGAKKPVEAGASYWGVMDLSGNLAEMYYNTNTYGRNFKDHYAGASHGDGTLDDDAKANVSTTYWPTSQPSAFGLRGGSFMSEVRGLSEGQIAVSDRSMIRSISSLDKADSTVTFRLGHSCSFLTYGKTDQYSSYLILENGKTSQSSASQTDSVCVNSTYTIQGTELLDKSGSPVNFPGRTNYIWYRSDNSKNTWQIIRGENSKDIVLSDWREDGTDVRLIYFKREAITPVGMHISNEVGIYVINSKYTIDRLVDTVRNSNQAMGFLVKTVLPATFTWKWKSAGRDATPLQPQFKNTKTSWYVPSRNDFQNIAKQNHIVQCDIRVQGKCLLREEMKIYLEERLNVAIASTEITVGGTDKSKECGVLMQDTRIQSGPGIYGTVRIGAKCWMAENLRYDGYPDVVAKSDDPSGEKYGYLYKYNEAYRDNICPPGWRLPTKDEFEQLKKDIGVTQTGLKMRAGNYWNYSSDQYMPTNTSGFGAMGVYPGTSANSQAGTNFGTYDNGAYYLRHDTDLVNTTSWGSSQYSVRCIKR